ncbi:MAG: hypothetical protein HYV23_04460 [Deltaproteobacteria bacterium]|nr:hypothetical protein [Deltaproteobacteria bacterium]
MPYKPFKLSGRALPALFLPLLLFFFPVLISCSQDKGVEAPVAALEKSAVEQPALQNEQEQAAPVSHESEQSYDTAEEPAGAVSNGESDRTEIVLNRDSEIAQTEIKLPQPAATEKEDPFEAGMGRREGGHFLVKFEGGENAVAGHLIGLLLEEAYFKVGSDLGHYPEERIEALLYSKEAFRDITRSPSWAGAIYDGRIKLPAGGLTGKTSALEEVIFHEYTHAVVRELSKGKAPVWLNEGLAQYEEGKSAEPYARFLSGLASRGALRLRPLEGSFMRLGPQEAGAAYLLSLSATSYIIREYGLFQVRSILERLAEGMELEEAISACLGVSYDELEKDWAASILGR